MRDWFKSGTPWVWLNAGMVSISIVMVLGLILLIAVRGLGHFWPTSIAETTYTLPGEESQRLLGEISQTEVMTAEAMREAGYEVPEDQEVVTRHLFKLGNRDLTGEDFRWYLEDFMEEKRYPGDAVRLERREWGDFYGYIRELREGDFTVASGPAAREALSERVDLSAGLMDEVQRIDRFEIGAINREMEEQRLERRRIEMDDNLDESQKAAALEQVEERLDQLREDYQELRAERDDLRARAAMASAVFETMDGQLVEVNLANVVNAQFPNAMGTGEKLREYFTEAWKFVSGYPREANTEGGILPAIMGTVTMVILMSVVVTPFGVLAAIYLREYARQGPLVRTIRVSVNNLAGVPSIVFGVFGLGFFVYFLGGNIDQIFYPEALPRPTFGKPALIWVSLTLALLTLPVVIVATEEGLSRIPRSVREGSLALGATKAETLWRTVVPMASPAMMTGMILAVARAAGEVAPLMLVGVVATAPALPIDGQAPFVHLDRSIMHLGFHIYDVGFQSPNVEAARPVVYATSLVLILLIVTLNLTAIMIRNHLREKFRSDGE